MTTPFEIDAYGKWCPFARCTMWSDDAPKEHVSYNRLVDENGNDFTGDKRSNYGASCIGKSCMAWRWSENLSFNHTPTGGYNERRGYCGLVGKPEISN